LLAEFLNFAGRPVEALEQVERAMRLNPLYPEWYLVQLGWAYRMTGRFQEALAAQKQVLVRNPNFLDAYTELVLNSVLEWTWQLSPDPRTLDQAFEAAQRAVHLNESWATAHAALSLVYVWQKQYERALAAGERALALGFSEGEGYAIVAEVLNFAGQPHRTIELMEKAPYRDYPYAYSWSVSQLGLAYYLTGRTEEAIAALKEASSRSFTHLGAHMVLAAAYGELGRQEEALAEVAAVRKLSPNFSLEVWRQRLPFEDEAVSERFLTVLRNAGVK
jgi:tetratricopeptide (TPR) repeat protein